MPPRELPLVPPTSTPDSGAVTSIYYDHPSELSAYHERLRREDGASMVRLRWYGDRDARDPGQPLFVEKKVHREAYTEQFSTKERAPLEQGGRRPTLPAWAALPRWRRRGAAARRGHSCTTRSASWRRGAW